MDDTVRILHTGDLHLDSPFGSVPAAQAERRRDEFRHAFMSMAEYVGREGIDIVLISGDLFEADFVTPETVRYLAEAFEAMKPATVIIAPGRHDFYSSDSLYAAGAFPSHVHVFRDPTLQKITLEHLPVTVYGWAWCAPTPALSPLGGVRAEEDRLRILVGHGALDRALQVSSEELAAFGAHYAALSERHCPPAVKRIGATYCGCSGFFAGRSFEELGAGGVHIVTATGQGGEWSLSFERASFSRCRYEVLFSDVTGCASVDTVLDKLHADIAAQSYDERTLLRVVATGTLTASVSFAEIKRRLRAQSEQLFHLEIVDGTLPLFSPSAETPLTVEGETLRLLAARLGEHKSGDGENEAAIAMKIAMTALEGRGIAETV